MLHKLQLLLSLDMLKAAKSKLFGVGSSFPNEKRKDNTAYHEIYTFVYVKQQLVTKKYCKYPVKFPLKCMKLTKVLQILGIHLVFTGLVAKLFSFKFSFNLFL